MLSRSDERVGIKNRSQFTGMEETFPPEISSAQLSLHIYKIASPVCLGNHDCPQPANHQLVMLKRDEVNILKDTIGAFVSTLPWP